ncbi:MAG: hypothetical protein PF638_10505 [Candidatus Delongbacteria bacterium]|jgi:hypothetical protein|nr:hypothetical protein [Candidatus Delongbacteria bacterium]
MKTKEIFTWILIVLILLSVSIIYVIKNNSNEKRMSLDQFYVDKLRFDIKQLKKDLENSKIQPRVVNEPELNKYHIIDLQRKGLANPEYDLKSDLLRHTELISYDAVLGGTMGFYEEGMRLLDNRLLARFEDGHIGGYMLLEYDVEPEGQINWKVLYSELEDGDF